MSLTDQTKRSSSEAPFPPQPASTQDRWLSTCGRGTCPMPRHIHAQPTKLDCLATWLRLTSLQLRTARMAVYQIIRTTELRVESKYVIVVTLGARILGPSCRLTCAHVCLLWRRCQFRTGYLLCSPSGTWISGSSGYEDRNGQALQN